MAKRPETAAAAGATRHVDSLAARVREAVRTRDWTALARVDAEIAERLRGHDAQRADAGELAAWSELRQAHQAAMRECRYEAQRLSEAMEQMGAHRQVWLAYAESQAWQSVPPHAKVAP